jgi:hypothetical protein
MLTSWNLTKKGWRRPLFIPAIRHDQKDLAAANDCGFDRANNARTLAT